MHLRSPSSALKPLVFTARLAAAFPAAAVTILLPSLTTISIARANFVTAVSLPLMRTSAASGPPTTAFVTSPRPPDLNDHDVSVLSRLRSLGAIRTTRSRRSLRSRSFQ